MLERSGIAEKLAIVTIIAVSIIMLTLVSLPSMIKVMQELIMNAP